ncbi:MAG TPA: thioredoxin domain-containing protein [Nitriliruptorales bacterium]|nr:thioredoxin domain-containing protein [Nitriliruptorales bacterium]
MANRLAGAVSPYLQQHADNPVDWYPWGEEAFAEARRRDVPVFLSVGYSSCHWCHVMAHESFEDDEVAALLNDNFVAVKVDREERPDVDAVYMDAVTALTGRGGWPMSVFLTPDGEPFFGGTYWPKEERSGMPGFLRVLRSVNEAWDERRDEISESASRIAAAIGGRAGPSAEGAADPTVSDRAAPAALRAWDRTLGGFGQEPKFPQAMTLEWLLDRHVRTGDPEALAAVTHSLDAMAWGGLHDQVGGGFHRYSTDARWLVPHFEKMLYDNALLLGVYAKAAAVTGEARFDRVAQRTADYLLRELRHPHGGLYSATDADSEGVEGKFFVWSMDEFAEVVRDAGADPDRFAAFFGVSATGNWSDPHGHGPQGVNILHQPVALDRFCEQRGLDPAGFLDDLRRVREALYERREQRVHPGLDDKVLTSWNALAVRGLALAGMHLALPELLDAAVTTANFLHRSLVVDGRLHHVWKDGTATVAAFLEDVVFLAQACLDLYAATGDVRWFESATRWAEEARARFHDDEEGGFFTTAHDAETLYTRPRDTWDNAVPSGNSVMGEVAARLAGYTGDPKWRELAEEVLRLFQGDAERAPTAHGWLLRVAEHLLAGPREVAVVGRPGPARDLLLRQLWARPLPGTVVAVAAPPVPEGVVPLLAGRGEVSGQPAAYVCREFACEQPVTDPDDLRGLLEVTA